MFILPFPALPTILAVQSYVAFTCRVTHVYDEHTEPSQTIRGHEIHFYVPCGLTLFHIWEAVLYIQGDKGGNLHTYTASKGVLFIQKWKSCVSS